MALNANYRDSKGQIYASGSVTLAPFTSIVLLKDSGTFPPPATLREPENPANAANGIDYSYYEGGWSSLPDFSSLKSVKTGTANDITFWYRNRDDNFAMRFTGYVNIPTDGTYTFYTSSDDGSKLYIGSTEVVNNDGNHGIQERSGVIGLKAGKHALTVTYYQGGGGRDLSVSYSGQGLAKQVIPASALYRVATGSAPAAPATPLRDPENPDNAVAGLDYSYYEGNWGSLPDFSNLTPVETGTAGTINLGMRNRDDNFGMRYTGYINVPADGVYSFYTSSDDGSKLYIGNTEVVSNDGTHPVQERSGSIGLKAGKHALMVVFFESTNGQDLSVSYSGPGLAKQVIPASALYRVATGSAPTTASSPALRDPENPSDAVAGLDYAYYEGNWGALPDFNSMTPIKAGSTGTLDLLLRNRDDNFAMRFTGYVNVPTDGMYTFYTSSDDGSKLFIGSTEVVSNDGTHPMQERSGTIGLKAGKHALMVGFFESANGQDLSVSYSGPGMGKQAIPASAYYRNGSAPVDKTSGSGLQGEYFNNRTLTDPSVLSRVDEMIDFDWGRGSPAPGTVNNDNFSVRWTGQVQTPASGNYTFSTSSDDGVRLWVDNRLIIDNWTVHRPSVNTGVIALTAGQKYNIRLEYFEDSEGAIAQLKWSYPGQSQQDVPQSRLFSTTGSGGRVSAPQPAVAEAIRAPEVSPGDDLYVTVYPVPARDELQVRYQATTAGQTVIELINTAGVIVMRQPESVIEGTNQIKVPVRSLNRGLYVLRLSQGNQRLTRKVVLAE